MIAGFENAAQPIAGTERTDLTRGVYVAPDTAAIMQTLANAPCGRCGQRATVAHRDGESVVYRCAMCAAAEHRADRLRRARAWP